MTPNWTVIVTIIVIIIVGLLTILNDISKLNQKHRQLMEFIAKFAQFRDATPFDHDLYTWLTTNTIPIQRLLGSYGIAANYIDRLQGVQASNYQIILQHLPVLGHLKAMTSPDPGILASYANQVQETVLRYLGVLDEQRRELTKSLRNPFVWLREGVRFIIAFPISVLNWFGFFSEEATHRIVSGRLFRYVSAFITTIGFISSIITLVLGWNEFSKLMGSLSQWLFP